MIGSYWVQIDAQSGTRRTRFYMQDCAGRDQVVRAVARGGWAAYEPPLPRLIARLCDRWAPLFLDVGANTGYYSLLAAGMGARHVWAFEPVPDIRTILKANVDESGWARRISISPLALSDEEGSFAMFLPDAGHGLVETSASLNPHFRARHEGSIEVQVTTLDAFMDAQLPGWDSSDLFMKIDVESLEPQVLRGASRLIAQRRPFLVLELLQQSDQEFFVSFLRGCGYTRFHLKPGGQLTGSKELVGLSDQHRDHLFVPDEAIPRMAQALGA